MIEQVGGTGREPTTVLCSFFRKVDFEPAIYLSVVHCEFIAGLLRDCFKGCWELHKVGCYRGAALHALQCLLF